MKAVIVALTVEERKAIQGIVDKIQRGKVMMEEGAAVVGKTEKELWEMLHGLYPAAKGIDKTFEYVNFEIRYFEPTTEIERIKQLKEKAIKDNDWEMAAKYRDTERKLKDFDKTKEVED